MKSNRTNQIVIVDDDPDYVLLLEKTLSTSEPVCSLKTVSSGGELFSWLDSDAVTCWPNMILLDVNMPVMNGFDVLKTLKADPRFKAIPVVMLSVSESKDDIRRAYLIGANAYIVKPITYEKLKERIDLFSTYWFDVAQTLISQNKLSGSYRVSP